MFMRVWLWYMPVCHFVIALRKHHHRRLRVRVHVTYFNSGIAVVEDSGLPIGLILYQVFYFAAAAFFLFLRLLFIPGRCKLQFALERSSEPIFLFSPVHGGGHAEMVALEISR